MQKYVWVLVSVFMWLLSCSDKEAEKSIAGDVYMVSQKVGQDTLYGLSIHAYSLYPMASATVTPANASEKSYQLKAYPGFKTDFYYDTPVAELSKVKPATGNYHFEARFETGEIDIDDDVLGPEVLFPPKVKSCNYDTAQKQALLEWEKVNGADVYVFKLYKQDTLVFLSAAIPATYIKASFSETSPGWGKNFTPKTGTPFKLKLSAFKYEPGGDNFNVQASTSTDTQLIWGGE